MKPLGIHAQAFSGIAMSFARQTRPDS